MGDAGSGARLSSRTHESAITDEAEVANRSRLAWKEEQLRVWDLLQMIAPWLLLTISTAAYFFWALPASGERFWPEGASALGLVVVSVLWVLICATRTLRGCAGVVESLRKMPRSRYVAITAGMCCTAIITIPNTSAVGAQMSMDRSSPVSEVDSLSAGMAPRPRRRPVGNSTPKITVAESRRKILVSTLTVFIRARISRPSSRGVPGTPRRGP